MTITFTATSSSISAHRIKAGNCSLTRYLCEVFFFWRLSHYPLHPVCLPAAQGAVQPGGKECIEIWWQKPTKATLWSGRQLSWQCGQAVRQAERLNAYRYCVLFIRNLGARAAAPWWPDCVSHPYKQRRPAGTLSARAGWSRINEAGELAVVWRKLAHPNVTSAVYFCLVSLSMLPV